DKALMERVGVVFPNQSSWGTHMNIAGGAVAKNAKNPANAVKFLEYLAGADAQNYFANGNNEWPTAKGVKVNNLALQSMSNGGDFKSETIPLAAVGANQVKVQQMLDRVGFKYGHRPSSSRRRSPLARAFLYAIIDVYVNVRYSGAL